MIEKVEHSLKSLSFKPWCFCYSEHYVYRFTCWFYVMLHTGVLFCVNYVSLTLLYVLCVPVIY